MSDRTDTVQTSTIHPSNERVTRAIAGTSKPTPTPMPGHLVVEHYDSLLKARVSEPLSDVAADTQISATGTITRVRHLDPGRFGRVMVVLSSDDGNSAMVSMGPDTVRMVNPLLIEGVRVTVYGTVARGHVAHRAGSTPAFIDGYNAQMVPVPASELLAADDATFWAHGNAQVSAGSVSVVSAGA
jgi:hypothetical protein